jgi:hypothetical protein
VNQRVDTLDRLLDKCRVGTGEFDGTEALAGVKIFQHRKNSLSNRFSFEETKRGMAS